MGLGLGTLGATAYLFLLLAGQVLGDDGFAPLGALWILVFLTVPAFLYPVEQELSRAVAARRAVGVGTGPLVRRAAVLAVALASVLVASTAALFPILDAELFDGELLLLLALMAALLSYAATYVVRGVFAGNGRLGAYGVLIAGEGSWRLLGATVLAVVGVETAGPYGLLVGVGPVLALLVVLGRVRPLLDPGPEAAWGELTASLGNLVAAALLSQVLVNAAPLIVKYAATSDEQAVAGAFAKAVVVSRIPLFLFQAVQAVMLPRLTHLATVGEHGGFRRALRDVMTAVTALGVLGTIGAFVLGPQALRLFGSDTGLPRVDITLLAAGNAAFLLCMTTSQALIALKGQGDTVLGWATGTVAFGVLAAFPGEVVRRVEIAFVVGAAVAMATMLVLLVRRLRREQAGADELLDGFTSVQTVLEL